MWCRSGGHNIWDIRSQWDLQHEWTAYALFCRELLLIFCGMNIRENETEVCSHKYDNRFQKRPKVFIFSCEKYHPHMKSLIPSWLLITTHIAQLYWATPTNSSVLLFHIALFLRVPLVDCFNLCENCWRFISFSKYLLFLIRWLENEWELRIEELLQKELFRNDVHWTADGPSFIGDANGHEILCRLWQPLRKSASSKRSLRNGDDDPLSVSLTQSTLRGRLSCWRSRHLKTSSLLKSLLITTFSNFPYILFELSHL